VRACPGWQRRSGGAGLRWRSIRATCAGVSQKRSKSGALRDGKIMRNQRLDGDRPAFSVWGAGTAGQRHKSLPARLREWRITQTPIRPTVGSVFLAERPNEANGRKFWNIPGDCAFACSPQAQVRIRRPLPSWARARRWCNVTKWVRGLLRKESLPDPPHPFRSWATPRCPRPRGERAPRRRLPGFWIGVMWRVARPDIRASGVPDGNAGPAVPDYAGAPSGLLALGCPTMARSPACSGTAKSCGANGLMAIVPLFRCGGRGRRDSAIKVCQHGSRAADYANANPPDESSSSGRRRRYAWGKDFDARAWGTEHGRHFGKTNPTNKSSVVRRSADILVEPTHYESLRSVAGCVATVTGN
jgi:hypothetical protein